VAERRQLAASRQAGIPAGRGWWPGGSPRCGGDRWRGIVGFTATAGIALGAVIGGVIVAVIYNGLELLGLGAAAQNIWTAVVLLAAVTVDTVARRGRAAA
jgi:hypothetical protein